LFVGGDSDLFVGEDTNKGGKYGKRGQGKRNGKTVGFYLDTEFFPRLVSAPTVRKRENCLGVGIVICWFVGEDTNKGGNFRRDS
jgi:hypothetical protein